MNVKGFLFSGSPGQQDRWGTFYPPSSPSTNNTQTISRLKLPLQDKSVCFLGWECPRQQFPASNCLPQRIMVTFSTAANNDSDSPIGNGCNKTKAFQTIFEPKIQSFKMWTFLLGSSCIQVKKPFGPKRCSCGWNYGQPGILSSLLDVWKRWRQNIFAEIWSQIRGGWVNKWKYELHRASLLIGCWQLRQSFIYMFDIPLL